ncbi:MAG: DUF4350 domain-containing protein [Thermoanaerobaculia bacterium]
MSAPRAWLVVLVALAALGIALVALVPAQRSGPSALSAGPAGWLAARAYLEARGAEVELLDEPPDAWPRRGTLVLASPWSAPALPPTVTQLRSHLRQGGTLLVAYSAGGMGSVERSLLEDLHLARTSLRGRPPLRYREWKRHVTAQTRLHPRRGGAGEVTVATPDAVPAPRTTPEVLWESEDGRVSVFSLEADGGRLVVLPADALSNARVEENLGLLEALRTELAGPWFFDEFHHGLRDVRSPEARRVANAMALFGGQLLLLYALGAWTLSRPFGRTWPSPRRRSATTAGFLDGVGELHHRAGHHREAAATLLARLAELEPRARVPADLVNRSRSVASAEELLDLTADVARWRRAWKRG